jgi:hypothetical protein
MSSQKIALGSKIFTGIAAAAVIATVTLAGNGAALAHGMGHTGGNMGGSMGMNKTISTTTKIYAHDHDRRRFRHRFFAFDYVPPYPYCFYKRTYHGLVKICPDLY